MKLLFSKTTLITPTLPFNFDATFFKPDHFTTNDHEYKKGTPWQTMDWRSNKLGLKFRLAKIKGKSMVELTVFSNEELTKEYIESVKAETIFRYNLNLDLREFYKFSAKDDLLARSIRQLKGMRPGHQSSLYEYLIIGIILQNASVRRSVQMFRNLLTKYGTKLEFDGHKLLCLWDVGRFKSIGEQELRDLKVGYRARSIIKIDNQFSDGNLDEFDLRKKSVDEQKKILLSLYGVGPATVWYLLFDVFHHWEVFEHISPWEQKLYSQMFFGKNLATIPQLFRYINKFGKYKHLAVHYIWEKYWWDRYNGKIYDWFEKEIRL